MMPVILRPFQSLFVVFVASLLLSAPVVANSRHQAVMEAIFADPAIAAFFVAEADRAKVGTIKVVHGQGPYGQTTWNGSRSIIEIFVDRSGARSPTNLAHEIAHAAAFRKGCFNHGKRWLNYHLEIAQRFEAQFPGVLWSGASPTQNVASKQSRYPNDRC